VDIVLGSDVIYGLHLAEWLPKVLDRLLTSNGTFYGVNPKNRWGVQEFVNNMEKLGFQCVVRTLPVEFCEDFVKKSCWDFFKCTKNPLS